jgi:two-component system cell cycle response regulator CpdR
MPHTILLVDDDPGILGTGALMLEDCGCVVLTAASAEAALAELNEHPEISHLLTDVQIPGWPAMNSLIARSRSDQVWRPLSRRELTEWVGASCFSRSRFR